MSGDTFEFDDAARVGRLTGTLHDPAATTGHVLTVQADKSIAAQPGGGSMPNAISNPSYPITGADTDAQTFTIAGDHAAEFTAGNQFNVIGSTSNDGWYTTASAAFADGATTVTTVEAPVDETLDGNLFLPTDAWLLLQSFSLLVPAGGFDHVTWAYIQNDLGGQVTDLTPYGLTFDVNKQVITVDVAGMYVLSTFANKGAADATHLGAMQIVWQSFEGVTVTGPNLQIPAAADASSDYNGSIAFWLHEGDTIGVDMFGTEGETIAGTLNFYIARVTPRP